MRLIHIRHDQTRRQLNAFGLCWFAFFAAFGALAVHKTHSWPAALTFSGLAVAIPLSGWIFPAWMRLVYLGMAYAAFPIGYVISHLVLAATYYLVLTPLGLALRLCGYDPMTRRFDRDTTTHWCPRQQRDEETGLSRYFHQF